jgi:putative ABC transport system permease protein
MLKNWLHIFLYQIKNNKLFTALNVLGLSIGIAGLIFAILYWNDEQSYNAWNPNKDKVFQSISQVAPDMYWASNVAALKTYFEKDFPELEAYCYLENWYYEELVQYKSKKEILKITDSQNKFFEFFPFPFVKGSAKTALKDNASMAISTKAAERLFGNEDPMGKEVRYSGRTFVIRGVYEITGKSSLMPEAVTNLIEPKLQENINHWGNFNHGLLLKLKNPDDAPKVVARMEKIMFENRVVRWAKEEGISVDEWLKKNGQQSTMFTLEPLSKSRLHSITDGFAEGRGNYQF